MTRRVLPLIAAGLLSAVSAPALADTDKDTPGGPCTDGPGRGTGNPCNGNQGNPSPQGNAKEKVRYDHNPPPFRITRPGNDRGAFITQIGDANRASIDQSANSQYANIHQGGDSNDAAVAQAGSGAHYALVGQFGDANSLALAQSGTAEQVALLKQWGDRNAMSVSQDGSFVPSGVFAAQAGSDNRMALSQSGGDNQAMLMQHGNGNEMTATQAGGGNQLSWTQTGDNLSDLSITQTGGAALQVTQTR